jgi:hypothetical protein
MEYQSEDGERSGVAGNGVGLLNGQNTKLGSIAMEDGEGLNMVNRGGVTYRGPRRKVGLGHVPKAFRKQIKGFHDY